MFKKKRKYRSVSDVGPVPRITFTFTLISFTINKTGKKKRFLRRCGGKNLEKKANDFEFIGTFEIIFFY